MPDSLTGEPFRHFRHELRTPLNHIVGFADVLTDDADDNKRPQLKPQIAEIRKAGFGLLETIQATFGELESLNRPLLESLETKLAPSFAHVRNLCDALANSGAYTEDEEQLEYLRIIANAVDQMAATLSKQIKDFA